MQINIKFLANIILFCVAMSLQACVDNRDYYPHYEAYHVTDANAHVTLDNVSSYQQTTNYTCGPAVVMTLLHHYGMLSSSEMNSQTEMRIAQEMNTVPSIGTTQANMVAWLEKHGFNVTSGQNISASTLIDNLNHNIPTIIIWNDFSEHAMLVVGYHATGANVGDGKDKIFTADPESSGYIEDHGKYITGIDTLSSNQLELNQMNARNFFNPTRSPMGLYITAVPR